MENIRIYSAVSSASVSAQYSKAPAEKKQETAQVSQAPEAPAKKQAPVVHARPSAPASTSSASAASAKPSSVDATSTPKASTAPKASTTPKPAAKAPSKPASHPGVELSISSTQGRVVRQSKDGAVIASIRPSQKASTEAEISRESQLRMRAIREENVVSQSSNAQQPKETLSEKSIATAQKVADAASRSADKLVNAADSARAKSTEKFAQSAMESDQARVDERKVKLAETREADSQAAEEKSAQRRKQLLEDFSTAAEEKKQANAERMKENMTTEEDSKPQPAITSFAGYTNAQIEQLYHQGRISYQSMNSEIEAREETQKEAAESIQKTTRQLAGYAAIMRDVLGDVPADLAQAVS